MKRLLSPLLAIGLLSASAAHSAGQTAYFADLPGQSGYRAAWSKMLKAEKQIPAWIRSARATSTPVAAARIDGKRYVYGDMCKPHDCFSHRFLGLFSQDKRQAWGLEVSLPGDAQADDAPAKRASYRWYGKPDAAQRDYLMKQLQADPNWK
ncbi:lysozyme inhibitor [Xenophilus sp. AP218F]|nr:lysozyme inhibitor [Xenophilus sp. AP218F]